MPGRLWTGTANGFLIQGARVKVVDVRGATLVVDGDAVTASDPLASGKPDDRGPAARARAGL